MGARSQVRWAMRACLDICGPLENCQIGVWVAGEARAGPAKRLSGAGDQISTSVKEAGEPSEDFKPCFRPVVDEHVLGDHNARLRELDGTVLKDVVLLK